jgi:hypothetical protein
MKKSLIVFIVYLCSWTLPVIAYFAGVAYYAVSSPTYKFHGELVDLGNNPEFVEEIIGADLPDYKLSDSYVGSGSEWTSYTYEFVFAEPLSEAYKAKLDALCNSGNEHWSKSYGDYHYSEFVADGYDVTCIIRSNSFDVLYSVNDGEDAIVDAIIPALIISVVLMICGVVLGIVALVRWMINRKSVPNN